MFNKMPNAWDIYQALRLTKDQLQFASQNGFPYGLLAGVNAWAKRAFKWPPLTAMSGSAKARFSVV